MDKFNTRKSPKGFLIAGLMISGLAVFLVIFYYQNSYQFQAPSNSVQEPLTQSPLSIPERKVTDEKGPGFEDFSGSEACRDCHQEEYKLWQGSTHSRAGGPPGPDLIKSDFSGPDLVFKDAVVKLSRNKNNEYIFTVHRDPLPQKVFKVHAVIGGGFMAGGGAQSYLSKFPDGTLRPLPFEFMKEKVWFCQTQTGWIPINEDLSLDECNNWPPRRTLGGGNYKALKDCQQCHGSQIVVQMEKDKKRYNLRYRSLGINCESCHGPGKRHVELMKKGRTNLSDIGMPALSTLGKDESLKICFQCHAKKRRVGRGEYFPGNKLEEHFVLNDPGFGKENDFYPDGRTKRFSYQKNHLFSDCYLNGSLKCVDCHNPHSQKYRDIYGKELNGKFSNGQCVDCHASKGISPEKHSHHQQSSNGNLCVSCHMAFFQHDIGNKLRLERADHTISIPRPELDFMLGRQNACQKCHGDKQASFLQGKIYSWYKDIKPQKEIIASLFEVDMIKNKSEAARQLLKEAKPYPVFQVAALEHFIRKFLEPAMKNPQPDIKKMLLHFGKSYDPDVRALAFTALYVAMGDDPEIRSLIMDKLKNTGGENLSFHRRLATDLNKLGIFFGRKGDYAKALTVFKQSLKIFPKDPMLHNNLGFALARKRYFSQAMEHFNKALKLNSDDPDIYRNLADLYARLGKEEAITLYLKAIEIDPEFFPAYNNLGNIYYGQKKYQKAIDYHTKALEINPRSYLTHMNLGLDLTEKGDLDGGLNHFFESLRFNSSNAEAHNNIALTFAGQNKYEKAVHHFSESIKIAPDNAETQNNLGVIFSRQGKFQEATVHYRLSIQIDPEYGDAHYNLGDAYVYLGKNENALNAFRNAYKIYLKRFGKNHGATLNAQQRIKDLLDKK